MFKKYVLKSLISICFNFDARFKQATLAIECILRLGFKLISWRLSVLVFFAAKRFIFFVVILSLTGYFREPKTI